MRQLSIPVSACVTIVFCDTGGRGTAEEIKRGRDEREARQREEGRPLSLGPLTTIKIRKACGIKF